MTYKVLDVVPDSTEWYERRRDGLGASDSAAILGLSKWATPLSVYRSKLGVDDRTIDPMYAWIGHKQEQTIGDWITEFHPEVGRLLPGMAVQSVEWPWLFATPDAVADDVGLLIPVEKKTSIEFVRDQWADGIPLYYQVQVQQQIAVLDAPYGWMAVFHGGRDFNLYRVERDQDFIDQLVRITGEWWNTYVVPRVEPPISTYSEALEAFPGDPTLTYELTEEQFANLEQRDVDASDMNHLKKRVDAFKDYIAPAVGDATVLTYQGEPAWTYKRQNGAPQTKYDLLAEKYPEAYAECVYQPRFPVLRRVKKKESK